jgi:hypothetical protein
MPTATRATSTPSSPDTGADSDGTLDPIGPEQPIPPAAPKPKRIKKTPPLGADLVAWRLEQIEDDVDQIPDIRERLVKVEERFAAHETADQDRHNQVINKLDTNSALQYKLMLALVGLVALQAVIALLILAGMVGIRFLITDGDRTISTQEPAPTPGEIAPAEEDPEIRLMTEPGDPPTLDELLDDTPDVEGVLIEEGFPPIAEAPSDSATGEPGPTP